MDTKNNSGPDINVLTKVDSENNFPIKFQPMSKRFIVWDKGVHKFYTDSNGIVSSGGIGWLAEFLNICGRPRELLEIIQFTDLFDKDGKEIFEGSILELENGKIVYVYYCSKFAEFVITGLGKVDYEDPVFAINSHAKVIGHVLSNPELLEDVK